MLNKLFENSYYERKTHSYYDFSKKLFEKLKYNNIFNLQVVLNNW